MKNFGIIRSLLVIVALGMSGFAMSLASRLPPFVSPQVNADNSVVFHLLPWQKTLNCFINLSLLFTYKIICL